MLNSFNVPRAVFNLGNNPILLQKRSTNPKENKEPICSGLTPLASSHIPQKGKNIPQIKKKQIK